MVDRPSGQILPIALTDKNLVSALHTLQKASYLAEAELINYKNLPPLLESLNDLIQCGESFLGFFEKDVLIGAISYKRLDKTLDIHRLVVHPDHFRKGIARQLLNNFEKNIAGSAERLIVSTASANHPAAAFYLNHGFTVKDRFIVSDGLEITAFEKELKKT